MQQQQSPIPRPLQGFQQTEQDHLTSKQRDKARQTNLYFKIPQAKPLLSKQYIDHGKPKVLIKQVKITRECMELSLSNMGQVVPSSQRGPFGRKEDPKLAESTLWRRYITSNNYRCIYLKYLSGPLQDFQGRNGKKLRLQLMKMSLNKEYLFGTYIMDINFISDGAASFLRNLEDHSLKDDMRMLEGVVGNCEFDSRFQCGNLMYVFQRVQSNNEKEDNSAFREFQLILQNDINTKGYGNWFYFKFLSKKRGKYRFTIMNMQKNYSFFAYGMRPAVFSLRKYTQNKIQWHYDGQNVVYHRNQLMKDDSGKVRFNTLSFTYDQTEPDDVIYFATSLPYSYSKLITYIDSLQKISKSNSNLYFRKQGLASTVSSNQCPLLTITWKRDRKREQMKTKKKIVIVIARQHPSEVVSSFVMQGFLNYLLQSGGENSVQLLKKYIFKIVPMANIDGVIYGNSRCDITGSDANRKWTKNPNQPLYPIITAIKKMVANLTFEGYEIEYFIDLHGHSRKLGSFIYACKNYDEVETRMFSWIMSKINDKFSYENCRFGISHFRRETARGYMMGIATNRKSMTVETSFFGYKGPNGMKQFQTSDLHSIGGSLAEAIYMQSFRAGKAINWNTIRSEIKATIHSKLGGMQEEEESSGSDSNPQVDELSVKEKVETFLNPAAATKLGLIDIKVVEKVRRQNKEENDLENEPYSNHEVFNQNYDTILNQKYLQSEMFTKTQKNAGGLKETRSVTKAQPFRFNSIEKKTFSLNKKIKIALDIQRVEKKEQRLSTPSLPSVARKPTGREFWSSLKKQYDFLVNQKKTLLKKEDILHPL